MDYFFKSFWLGALLQPKVLAYALKRNPMVFALVAAILLFCCLCVKEGYLVLAVWFLGTFIAITTPRRHYKLKSSDYELYVCLYDCCHSWDIDVEDEYRPVILRVFEKREKKWRTLVSHTLINGFDDKLEPSGFLLIKLENAQWGILGNGHTVENLSLCPTIHDDFSFNVLGEKLDQYVFLDEKTKEKTLKFISGQEVISFKIIAWEKCERVCLDMNNLRFEELKKTLGSFSSANGLTAGKDGIFFLVEQEDLIKLFKVVYKEGIAAAYQVFTKRFSFKRKHIICLFESSPKQGYFLLKEKFD